jgi:hypothetical protein
MSTQRRCHHCGEPTPLPNQIAHSGCIVRWQELRARWGWCSWDRQVAGMGDKLSGDGE